MAKEGFLQKKDRDEDEPQPRRGSGKTKKRLAYAGAIGAGILPGTALAQAPSQPVKPSLPDQILAKQLEIWQATNGDPTYVYPDRNALAGVSEEHVLQVIPIY